MNNVKEGLRSYILAEFLPGESPENLQYDTPLLTSRILDSLATLNLVSYVEETYGIELEAHEIGVETFDTIDGIAALVVR